MLIHYNNFSISRCFCFNPTGARIFGWSWWKTSQNMTCSCSRHAEKLKASRKDVSLHCAENGNYEKLQCDNGLCWCVEPMSGKPIQRAYPESMMTRLPCYDEKDIGNTYFRQCESKSVARAKLLESLRYHGHKYFYIENVFCDNDGSYGHYKISGKFVQCTWKDGSRIGEYLSAIENIKKVNCNCARDSLIFAESKMDFRSICSSDGNYEPIQYINGRPFCVDSDGFATGVIGDIGEALKC